MNAVQVLMEGKKLIERGWCQGALARNEGGLRVPIYDSRVTSVCSVGALVAGSAEHGDVCEAEDLLRVAAGVYHSDVPTWNDDPQRTKEEVIQAFDDAIALGLERMVQMPAPEPQPAAEPAGVVLV